MKAVNISDDNEPRKRLLREAAGLYLDAVTAMIEYQKEVQNKCRDVLKNHIEDYGAVLNLKVPLKSNEIKNAA